MSWEGFVCIEDGSELNELERKVRLLEQRSNVFETLAGVNIHPNVLSSCVLLQRFFRYRKFQKSLTNTKSLLNILYMRGFYEKWLLKHKEYKKMLSETIIKNSILTMCHRKRFLEKKKAAVIIQTKFRYSINNVSYPKTCRLIREVQYLNQTIESKRYLIKELRKKIKTQQKQSSRQNTKWFKKNILDTINNTEYAKDFSFQDCRYEEDTFTATNTL